MAIGDVIGIAVLGTIISNGAAAFWTGRTDVHRQQSPPFGRGGACCNCARHRQAARIGSRRSAVTGLPPTEGPYEWLRLAEDARAPFYVVPLDKDGVCSAPLTRADLLRRLAEENLSDIFDEKRWLGRFGRACWFGIILGPRGRSLRRAGAFSGWTVRVVVERSCAGQGSEKERPVLIGESPGGPAK